MALLHVLTALGLPLTPTTPPPVIVRRHDRADSAYVALARQFPCVGTFGRMGDGTLIAPTWVITAAHVARGVMARMATPTIRFGGHEYPVKAVFIHPAWTDLGPHDMALVQLAAPVRGIVPARLYDDNREAAQVAYLVGNGKTGTGATRDRVDDDIWRAATSRVDSTSATSLFLSFDAPPDGTELEGAPSAGDSGGPALLRRARQLYVAGISSAGFDGASGPASYGAVDVYTRVSTHRAWAASVLAGKVAPTAAHSSAEPRARAASSAPASDSTAGVPLPDTPAGRRAGAFVVAMRAGSDSAILAFLNGNFASGELAARPAAARLPNFRRLSEQLRNTRVLKVRESTPSTITFELTTVSGTPLALQFLCEEAAPYAIVDWRRYE